MFTSDFIGQMLILMSCLILILLATAIDVLFLLRDQIELLIKVVEIKEANTMQKH